MTRRTRRARTAVLLAGTLALGAGLLAPSAAGAAPKPGPKPAPEVPGGGDLDLDLNLIGRYVSGVYGESAAEITAWDPDTARLFVVSAVAGAVDVLDLSDPTDPRKVGELDAPGANSVAVHDGLVAVAREASPKTDPGTVAFFRASDLRPIREVRVGALPDALTFTPDGRRVVVANEGEPDSYCADGTDPEGTISVITIPNGTRTTTLNGVRVATADFRAWNGREDELRAAGVRIFGPGASAARDLEPEYVAVSGDSKTAWVTLQENNAITVVHLPSARVTDIVPLGLKDHSLPGNGLDASDRDNAINITEWPVMGMYQPDSIAAFAAPATGGEAGKGKPGKGGKRGGSEEFLVIANEGDARDWGCYNEEVRVNALTLSPEVFPNAAELRNNANLGRLTVSVESPRDERGRVTELHVFGGRSVSVLDSEGRMVWDSGDHLERLTAELFPGDFNANNSGNDSFDTRSDNKGPEPEGVVVGTVDGTPYAFVGLERIGGVVVYDLTDPRAPRPAGYVNSRDFSGDAEAGTAGDLGPEGLTFIPAEESPNGRPLLVVAHEVSGTTTVYEIS
ncbi:choice-of-anchor I family protein [Streptomyces alkaliphilus]|uniref:choice-of-anchor I family protein n=1 Tax=Streptomyces alkaliphilus TaxID=1472722 RepID=UPI0012961A90|nr:choice-of-anchor I family protein [Streptomyces alkaliphilus]